MLLTVIPDTPILLEAIERAAGEQQSPVPLQNLKTAGLAQARIAGGGVDAVVLDISSIPQETAAVLQHILSSAGRIPVALVCDPADEEVAMHAVKGGAWGYAGKQRPEDVKELVSAMLRQRFLDQRFARRHLRGSQRQIALIGAKGGVGTTTTALNVAAALAQTREVILVEMRPELATLAAFFPAARPARDLAALLADQPVTSASAQASLYECPEVPDLRLLFATPSRHVVEFAPKSLRSLCAALSELAGLVLLDLPSSLSAANRSVIEACDQLAVVTTREPVCVALAKQIAAAIRSWNAPAGTGAIVVNQEALVSPVSLAGIESELEIPCFGALPPAADLCVRAQSRRQPPLVLDRESPLAQSSLEIATRLVPQPVLRFR